MTGLLGPNDASETKHVGPYFFIRHREGLTKETCSDHIDRRFSNT